MSEQNSSIKQVVNYYKKLMKKIEGLPQPRQTIRRRAANTAAAILDNLRDVPFNKLAMSIYFYSNDLRMKDFTRYYESQLELAAVNPEKFFMGLHNFYNEMAVKIKKNNLQQEYIECLYLCNRRRWENANQNVEDNVIIAYINLLIQQMAYLLPSKYDFNNIIVGMNTSGELMTAPDFFPKLDIASYELEGFVEKLGTKNIDSLINETFKKYDYPIHNLREYEEISNIDKGHISATIALLPLINEFTFDIYPQVPYTCFVIPFEFLSSHISSSKIKEDLSKRNKTLPSNGVEIHFKDNSLFKGLLLKEIYFNDSIFMLYRLATEAGDLSGYYDTKEKFFFNVLVGYKEDLRVVEHLSSLILYLYGCYVLNNEEYQLSKVNDLFTYNWKGNKKFLLEGYLRGGKLRNTYDKNYEKGEGTARIGNDNYETEMKAIQGYIRKLPAGHSASEKAIALATSLGYELQPNETYVQPFIKHVFKLKKVE